MGAKLHEEVFSFLENYRSTHPEFVYWLRERNRRNRLSNGYWFQGTDDYCFVGLYNRGGGTNMTRSIGLVFYYDRDEEGKNELLCYLELAYKNEKDHTVIRFYQEVMKLLGGFDKLNYARYKKHLPGGGKMAATEFLNNIKPGIDTLLRKNKLDHLFIKREDFNNKLRTIHKLRETLPENLFPANKIAELKRRFEIFRKETFFSDRKKQLSFISFAQKVITNTLNGYLTNDSFTGLIQILKHGAKEETVNDYIDKVVRGDDVKSSLKKEFASLGFTGFTGAGKAGISDLDNRRLEAIKKFILDCSVISNKQEAVKRVEDFEQLEIPQVKSGVYSPWLYYMNPLVFPIKNNRQNGFIKWCGHPADSYPLAILLFHEVAEIIGEKDLGLIDAFTYNFSEEDTETIVTGNNEINTMSLNTILYGPPGTGKTYHTVNKAVAIANPEFDFDHASREKLKAEYERLVKDGQIEFVTFHQNVSYEDFIEGIKPMEPKEADPFLKYEIKEGIFKRLCERASKVPETKPTGVSISEDEFQKAGFYKLSLGDTSNPDDDQIYSWCTQNGYIALGYGDAINFTGKNENEIQQMVPAKLEKFAAQSVNYFIHYLKTGDYVVVTYGNLQFRAIGKVAGNYEYKNVNGLNVHQFRKIDWLVKDIELPYEEVYNKQFSQQTIYRLDKREIKKDFFVKAGQPVAKTDTKTKNYVLVIDEINRGNISQIFGELITLIEEDKRAGKEEALTVTLPYSKKIFSVPSNLYVIGTMNTADRSIEALDTALRRRFTFEEIKPQPELLSPQRMIWKLLWDYKDFDWDEEPYKTKEVELFELLGIKKGFTEHKIIWAKMKKEGKSEDQITYFDNLEMQGINLARLLEKINARLLSLLDKDHTIGHAWLLNIMSVPDLQAAFKNKILPLLQEFFYNDYAKIGLVLGDKFVSQEEVNKGLFAKFKDNNELAAEFEGKTIYTLKDPFELSLEDFKSIYQ